MRCAEFAGSGLEVGGDVNHNLRIVICEGQKSAPSQRGALGYGDGDDPE